MTMKWSWVQVSWLMLLFSGCLVAVGRASTLEAAGRTTIATDVITLQSFTWATKETREPYTSLKICWEDDQDQPSIDGDTVFTLVYTNAEGTQLTVIGKDALLEGSNCVKFGTEGDVEISLPPHDSEITYELHIGNGGTTELLGVAIFTLDTSPYEVAGPMIQCGDSYYTRGLVKNAKDCKGDDQTLIAKGNICYTTAADPEKLVPDEDGCMEAPGATPEGLLVCLSDKELIPAKNSGDVTVDSLNYGSDASANVQILATYAPKDSPPPNPPKLELLLQDASSAEPFHVSPCTDDVTQACGIEGYPPAVKTYQVCAVGVVDDQTLLFTDPAAITDLNLAAIQYEEKLEFSFNNARPKAEMYYYATVDNAGSDGETAVPVGINCRGVARDYTCYGFLNISGLTPGDLLLTVEYGDGPSGNVTSADLNKIIGTYTKTAPTTAPTAPPTGGPQVEE